MQKTHKNARQRQLLGECVVAEARTTNGGVLCNATKTAAILYSLGNCRGRAQGKGIVIHSRYRASIYA